MTSLVNSAATLWRHIAGMWRTVGSVAESTSVKQGTRTGQGLEDADPGRGGVPTGVGSIGTGSPGGSGGIPRPPGPARQFLHLVPAGTSVLQGSSHSLILRWWRTASGTFCPWDTCFAARWLTSPLRVLWMRESGHEVKGHDRDGGPISAMFSVSEPSLSQSIAPPSIAGTNGAWIRWPLPLPRPLPLPLPTTSDSRAIVMSTSVCPNGGWVLGAFQWNQPTCGT